jgi:hypothetical protein
MEWLGSTELRAQDVLDKQKDKAKNGNQDRKLEAGKALLRMKFNQAAEHKCTDLYDEAGKEDISVDTLKRAKRALKDELAIIVDDRRGAGLGYWWVWPGKRAKDAAADIESLMEAL